MERVSTEEAPMRILLILILLTPVCVSAQESGEVPAALPGPCTASEYRAFDFWIGDWTVTSKGT